MKTNRVVAKWFLAAAIAALAVVVVAQVWAQSTVARPRQGPPGSWRMVGSVQANFRADHDGIVVQGFDDFRRIKFKVTGAALNMERLVVTYENGQPENIAVRSNIPEGGESRQIDLAGSGKRRIRRIDFWYKTQGVMNGKANVTVFGMK